MTDNRKIALLSTLVLFGWAYCFVPMAADDANIPDQEQATQSNEIIELTNLSLWLQARRQQRIGALNKALTICATACEHLKEVNDVEEIDLVTWNELQIDLLIDKGSYQAAKVKQEKALAQKKSLFGPDAPSVIAADIFLKHVTSLASLNETQQKALTECRGQYVTAMAKGDIKSAITACKRHMKIEEGFLGPESSGYAESASRLADLYIKDKEYEKAELHYRESITISEKLFGPEHPVVAHLYFMLSNAYKQQGEEQTAYEMSQKGSRIYKEWKSYLRYNNATYLRDKVVSECLSSLGIRFCTIGDYQMVTATLSNALNYSKSEINNDDLYYALFSLYAEKGDFTKANRLLEKKHDAVTSGMFFHELIIPIYANVGLVDAALHEIDKLSELSWLFEYKPLLSFDYLDFEPYGHGLCIQSTDYKSLGFIPEELASVRNLLVLDNRLEAAVKQQKKILSLVKEYESASSKYNSFTVLEQIRLQELEKVANLPKADREAWVKSEKKYYKTLSNQPGLFGGATGHEFIAAIREVARVQEKYLGSGSLKHITLLCHISDTVANHYATYDDYDRDLITIFESLQTLLGPNHPATLLKKKDAALTFLYNQRGHKADLLRAETMLKSAVDELWEYAEETLYESLKLKSIVLELSDLYIDTGNAKRAEPLLLRLSDEFENNPDEFGVAGMLQLGRLYRENGNQKEAVEIYKRLLKINRREEEPNPFHDRGYCYYFCEPESLLVNLAWTEFARGNANAAEKYFREAIDKLSEEDKCTWGGLFGPPTLQPHVKPRQEFAVFLMSAGRLDEAEKILRNLINEENSTYEKLDLKMKLGSVLVSMDRIEEGHKLYQELIPALKESDQYRLAEIYSKLGLDQDAIPVYEQVVKVVRNISNSRAALESEHSQLARIADYQSNFSNYLGHVVKIQHGVDLAYTNHINWKGAVSSRQRLVRFISERTEIAPLLKQLQKITAQLAKDFRTRSNSDSNKDKLDALSLQKRDLESQISRLAYEYLASQKEVTGNDISRCLPHSAVLIDYFNYDHKSGSGLGAFIVRPKEAIKVVDIYRHVELNNLVESDKSWKEIENFFWQPLVHHVEDTELILYSPVGDNAWISFATLPGKKPGSYLIEEKQLVMIPQAKQLPTILKREQSPEPSVLAIGGVDYDTQVKDKTQEPVQLASGRRAVRWKDEAVFTPLPETESELDAIGKLYNQQFDLGKLQTLKDDRATEAAVKRLAPQYSHLHFATHGFFAPPEVKSALDNSDNQFQRQLSFDGQPRVTGFHPGLLSGLALAGANNPPEEGEDGIWTAEEVATMNLSNVDLAVLSACETGLGKVAGGEGLLGLQRAFQVSGAGTTVASLWQVDDAATRALMDEFYRNLWEKKLPKIEALRQAQLKMLREYDPQKGTLRGVGGVRQLDADAKPERLPPSYWAAWVLSGDWR